MRAVAAIDLGATSGRVIVGTIGHQQLSLRHVARFPNTPVRTPDALHWDVLSLYSAAMNGLGQAAREEPELAGVAVDSWAVDYALLRNGRLLGNPVHYRDERNARVVEAVHAVIPADELYRRNGLQHLPFNTVFQLAAEKGDGLLDLADLLLLIPDLFGYWATGVAVAEQTNASTTGLLRIGERGFQGWDTDLLARLGLPARVLPDVVEPGGVLGPVGDAVRSEYGIPAALTWTLVGSHDTASAVVGIPDGGTDVAYISCGTWSLVGTELDRPVTTEDARRAGYTNEGGVDGRIRFLHNVMGLWLLNETMRTWAREGEPADLEQLLAGAADAPADVPTFDPDDRRLLAPGDMPARIAAILAEQGRAVPPTRAELVRSILQSLANAYAACIEDIERLTGRTIRKVHITGGGAQNGLLCQMTADATGRSVIAGPVEATAIGNLLVQARTLRFLSGDLETLRSIVAFSFPPRAYAPRTASRLR